MPDYTRPSVSTTKWKDYHPFRRKRNHMALTSDADAAGRVARKIAHELVGRFGASKVVLFGSLARGDFKDRSDIDLAVWGIPSALYFRAVAFATGFSPDWRVDIIDADECPPSLLTVITEEGLLL
jgi:uncharacterized protein